MNKIFKKIIYLTILTIIFFGSFGNVSADEYVSQLGNIIFESSPLFKSTDFVPGGEVTKYIKFKNSTSVGRRTYINVDDVIDTDKLGDAIKLTIKKGDTTIYENTFSNFFSKGRVELPQLNSGETNIIYLTATFIPESGDEYQDKTLSFGLQAVIEDLEESGDTTTAIGSSGGSGGGGSGDYYQVTIGPKKLVISGESVNSTRPAESTFTTVSWSTNIPATSQVVFGLVSGGPYTLNLNLENFGYPSGTVEDKVKVLSHFVTLSGIVPEQEYIYRVVSRASPPTISYEHTFVLKKDGTVQVSLVLPDDIRRANEESDFVKAQNNTSGVLSTSSTYTAGIAKNQNSGGDVLSASVDKGMDKEVANNNSNQVATALFGAGFLSWKSGLFFLFILVLILVIFWKRRRHGVDVGIK